MNIFRVSSTILYPLFVYVLFFSKWILVESTESSADPENGTNSDFMKYSNHVKLFKADPNDSTKTVELAKTEYNYKFDVDEHIYEFNSGVNCSLIKIEDKEVWQYGSTTPDPTKTASSTDGSTTPDPSKSNPSESETKYPNGMNIEEQVLFIYFGEYTKVYAKKEEGWILYMTSKKDLNKSKVLANDPNKKGN